MAFTEQTLEMKKSLNEIYESLKEANYDPISQIVGYLNSGDPGYVPNFNNARDKIISLDRYDLIETLLKEFLNK